MPSSSSHRCWHCIAARSLDSVSAESGADVFRLYYHRRRDSRPVFKERSGARGRMLLAILATGVLTAVTPRSLSSNFDVHLLRRLLARFSVWGLTGLAAFLAGANARR